MTFPAAEADGGGAQAMGVGIGFPGVLRRGRLPGRGQMGRVDCRCPVHHEHVWQADIERSYSATLAAGFRVWRKAYPANNA